MDRIILHCDLNSFYASVELRSHPDLRDVPTAVCGDPTSRHGIILAKNEPAKKFGVQTAETIWQARKKCPGLVLLPPHHSLYRQVSKQVNAIYEQYTDLVEPFGIDESWLDVTHTLHLFGGDAKALADHLRQRMRREMGLTHDLYFSGYLQTEIRQNSALLAKLQLVALRAAQQGDPAAQDIYRRAAEELTETADAIRRQLDFPAGEPVPVSYSGGLFRAGETIMVPFRACMERAGYTLVQPKYSPVLGALILAARGHLSLAESDAMADRAAAQL